MTWRSRIEDWDPPSGFAYTQVRGPFAFWKHAHFFEPQGTGTLMTDLTTYRLLGGRMGDLLLQGWMQKEVEAIFQFRRDRIREIFSLKKGCP